MLLHMRLDITMGSADMELQDMHVHIKSEIIRRKEVLDIAVLHSFIGNPL